MENYNTENLFRVWERVSQPTSDAPAERKPDAAAQLRAFIDDEAADAAMYTLLAIKSRGGPAEQAFRCAAADEKRHEKRLQSEYFLLTGDTFSPKVRQPSAPYLLTALRERYIAEGKGAEAYENAAKCTEDPRTKSMYFELARDERRHALSMRALIDKFID